MDRESSVTHDVSFSLSNEDLALLLNEPINSYSQQNTQYFPAQPFSNDSNYYTEITTYNKEPSNTDQYGSSNISAIPSNEPLVLDIDLSQNSSDIQVIREISESLRREAPRSVSNVATPMSNEFLSQPSPSPSTSSLSSANYSTSDASLKRKRIPKTDQEKRQSHKEASTRYRNKKLKEQKDIFAECKIYAEKNKELRKKIDHLQDEMNLYQRLVVQAFLQKNKLEITKI